jgi:D-alanine-D-alanine ligase
VTKSKPKRQREFKKLRVLVLVHGDLVPPDSLDGYTDKEIQEWKTEFDVVSTLRTMGHDVRPLGVSDDLGKIRKEVDDWQPHIAFNLLEEFHGVSVYDQHVVSYLELLRQPYTGCNPRGLLLAHDKALCKQILAYHRILTPRFVVYPLRRTVKPTKRLSYPLVVKSVSEEASLGISQASIVTSDEKLKDRVDFVHQHVQSDALVEEYIEGRELYVAILGNQRLRTFPIWELLFTKSGDKVPLIATAKVKWDYDYQQKLGVETHAAKDLPEGAESAILKQCIRTYRALYLTGYARVDLRLAADGRAYVLEANPNPNLSYGEDFAESAEASGLKYPELLHRIITLGGSYKAAWRE